MNRGVRGFLRPLTGTVSGLVAGLILCAAAGAAQADVRLDALAQARHDLAVSEQVLGRLSDQVAAVRASPATSTGERARLDDYLAKVKALVAANRERVRSLEKDIAERPAGAGTAAQGQPVAMTESERIAVLDTKLNGSLEAFDQMLLDEARKARTRDAETRAASRNGGNGKANGGGKGSTARNGDAKDSEGEGEAAGSPKESGNAPESGAERSTEAGSPRGAREGSPGGRIGGHERGTPGPQASAPPPPDVGDGSDDDIVARQIRKAAEAEADPELRKKLWDEYRKYKQGIVQGAS